MATAMSNVREATNKEAYADSYKEEHKQGFQSGWIQIHRLCEHSLNVGGEVVRYSNQIYQHSEESSRPIDYWIAEARRYINENIIRHMYNVPYLTTGQSLQINYGIEVPANNGWWIQNEVTVADGHWGNWGPMHMCPPDHYAVAAKVRDEAFQGGGSDHHGSDDTALNGYQMKCIQVKGKFKGRAQLGHYPHLRTEAGLYGDWTAFETCEYGSFIAGHRIRIEPPQGGADDAAANGIAMACRGSVYAHNQGSTPNTYPAVWNSYGGWTRFTELHHVIADQHKWGNFGYWGICPDKTYMCGFSLRIEPDQGSGDDTSMNGMRMTCCRMPWDEA
jgi:hypothetical protein